MTSRSGPNQAQAPTVRHVGPSASPVVRMVTVRPFPARRTRSSTSSALIRFDYLQLPATPETTKARPTVAEWVAERLREVGYDPEYVEPAHRAAATCSRGCPAPTRPRRPADPRSPRRGARRARGLERAPVLRARSKDGYVWGRGAVDMKDMAAMMIAVAGTWGAAGVTCRRRDLVFAFVSDEEHGGTYGCAVAGRHRPDLFEGVTEAIGEVGGFSLTVRDDGGERLYLDRDGREGHVLDAADGQRAGPATARWCTTTTPSRPSPRPSTKVGRHQFPLVLTESVEQFLAAVSEETGYDLDRPSSTGPGGHLAKLGGIARIVGATLREHREPDDAQGRLQGQRHPGDGRGHGRLPRPAGLRKEAFERQIDELIGANDHPHAGSRRGPAVVETTFDGDLGRPHEPRAAGRGPRRPHRAVHDVGRHRREGVQPPGIAASASRRCGCRPSWTSPRCSTGSTSACRSTACGSAFGCSIGSCAPADVYTLMCMEV
jgi:hypothetical protein